jgi:hypothetical protein
MVKLGTMRFMSIISLGSLCLSLSLTLTGCGVEWGLNARHFGYEKPGVLSLEEARALEAKQPKPVASKLPSPEYNEAPTSTGGQKLEASKLRYNSVKAN